MTLPQLQSFPDGSAPTGLFSGFRALQSLPRGAQQNLWPLVQAELGEPDAHEYRQLVEAFCARFDVNAGPVLGAARACAFLFRHAASLRLDREAFTADLQQLAAEAGTPDWLPSHYEAVRDELRIRLLEDSLADHGKVLVGFDWRIDHVRVSNHGHMLDAPVVFLNLKYRQGKQHEQLPLQLTPSAMASLKDFLKRFEAE